MIRQKLTITGNVQGVGFRPFIYRVAKKLNLKGYVKNNPKGVVVEIEGLVKDIELFKNSLVSDLPPLAKIDNIKTKEIEPLYRGQFKIIQSDNNISTLKTASIPPDTAICENCKFDTFHVLKYSKYFATNCTNCGPRYNIIKTVPYDRVNTSMKNFSL